MLPYSLVTIGRPLTISVDGTLGHQISVLVPTCYSASSLSGPVVTTATISANERAVVVCLAWVTCIPCHVHPFLRREAAAQVEEIASRNYFQSGSSICLYNCYWVLLARNLINEKSQDMVALRTTDIVSRRYDHRCSMP